MKSRDERQVRREEVTPGRQSPSPAVISMEVTTFPGWVGLIFQIPRQLDIKTVDRSFILHLTTLEAYGRIRWSSKPRCHVQQHPTQTSIATLDWSDGAHSGSATGPGAQS
jgi:hypothetical protein